MRVVYQSFDSKELEKVAVLLAEAGIQADIRMENEQGFQDGHLFVADDLYDLAADLVDAVEQARAESEDSELCPECGSPTVKSDMEDSEGAFVAQYVRFKCISCEYEGSRFVN